MDRSRIAVVIPALNEASTIGRIVSAVGKYGVPIVVDDGSTDSTAELAINNGAVVVSHKTNLGYDAALNTGFKKANELNFLTTITVDADGQHDPAVIEKFLNAIDMGADVVIGIRNQKQRITERVFAVYTRLRFNLQDPLCGMKAYRMTVYQSAGQFDSYSSIGTELMLFAAKNNYRCVEIPLVVKDRDGRPRFGGAFGANVKILRALIFSWWLI